jgi:hypothetical protein
MMEKRDIRLKDIAVAIGAPMKPSRIGSGPHTGRKVNRDRGEANDRPRR